MTVVEHGVPVETPAVPVFPELVRAAGVLRECGWHQGGYYANWPAPYTGGPVCVGGAIGIALKNGPGRLPEDAIRSLNAIQGTIGGSLVMWNDAPERTQDEVIELLERVGYGI